MIPLPPRAARIIPTAVFAAAVVCAPVAGAEQTPGQWEGETQVNNTAYVSLESIRSFYKLTPQPAAAGGGEIVVGNGGMQLAFHRRSSEARIGGYRCRLSHPVTEDSRGDLLISKTDAVKLIDPLLRPTYIAPRRVVRSVVIDPGHGGQDVGIVSNQVREADLTLLLARKLKNILTQRGVNVLLTREQNHAVSDRQRINTLTQADAPVFISLHANSGRSDIKGIETYSLQPAGIEGSALPGNATDEANSALAFCLHSSLVSATGAEDGAFRRARFSLLSSTTCPAAMVLVGYATHPEESAALNTEEYQDKLALAIADGITTFAKAVNPDATVPVTTVPVDTAPPTPYKANNPAPTKKAVQTRRNTGGKNKTKPPRKKRRT